MNKKHKNHKSFRSFAIKLNSVFVRSLFLKFLFIDIVIVAGSLVIWCIDSELDFYGSISETAKRSIVSIPDGRISYRVIWDDNTIMLKNMENYLYLLARLMIAILIVEGIFLLLQIMFGTARNRRILKPLNEIAEATTRLSDIEFDEEKFHNLEDAINNLLDRMRESYREQARFVSDASHELRTPISVIQGYANMLDRWGKEDEEVLEESIIAIKSESENMKNLVEQLLFLARGINGKTKLNAVEFSLNDMMKEVYEESKMIDKDHIYIYEEVEKIYAYGDTSLLKQTARILIENASKYTDKNEEIILKIGRNSKGEPYFYVQDNGIGMDENDVPHIFERFFRADTARTRKTGGTGLGLSIANWIIKNHKGYFSVISRKGIGTRITVFLPCINLGGNDK